MAEVQECEQGAPQAADHPSSADNQLPNIYNIHAQIVQVGDNNNQIIQNQSEAPAAENDHQGPEIEQDPIKDLQAFATRNGLKATAPIRRNSSYVIMYLILIGTTLGSNYAFTSATTQETTALVKLLRTIRGEFLEILSSPPPQGPKLRIVLPRQQTEERVTPLCDGSAVILSALSALVLSWIPTLGRKYDLSKLLDQLSEDEKSRLWKRVKELMEERDIGNLAAVDENRKDDMMDVLKIGLSEALGIQIAI